LTETRNESYRQIIAIAIGIKHPIPSCLPVLCYILILRQLLRVYIDYESQNNSEDNREDYVMVEHPHRHYVNPSKISIHACIKYFITFLS